MKLYALQDGYAIILIFADSEEEATDFLAGMDDYPNYLEPGDEFDIVKGIVGCFYEND
jgi:hypothetical protein